MKIYNISEIPEGLRVPSYEEVLLSGYTDGYEDGYDHGKEYCKPYEEMYFTVESHVEGIVTIKDKVSHYRINYYDWKEVPSGGTIVSVGPGDRVEMKGVNYDCDWLFSGVTMPDEYAVFGNAMSLLYGDEFADKYEIQFRVQSYGFRGLLADCTGLTDASHLVLQATVLQPACYDSMFSGCTSLEYGPELPATTLTDGCYDRMFAGCTNLVSTPELPATNLALSCYYYMFSGCTSITEAPELPATTLAENCYAKMFSRCENLAVAPELPATTLADSCYGDMFEFCTSLTSAPELPATVMANGCYFSMFTNCSNLETAPALPATTLAEGCYMQMFWGCYSLTSAPALPATTLARNCYNRMFWGCGNITSAPELLAETLVEGCYERMFASTHVNYVKCLATDISATNCTDKWLWQIYQDNGTFVKACNVVWSEGDSGIPTGWTVEEDCHGYENMYFTVEALVNGQITVPSGAKWRVNGGAWNDSASTDTIINVEYEDKVEMSKYSRNSSQACTFYNKTMPRYKVYGNIMSLIWGDDFMVSTGFNSTSFYNTFRNQTWLMDAENLVLPETTLVDACYSRMFDGCANLAKAPTLPAATLAEGCYRRMFYGCAALEYVKCLAIDISASNSTDRWLFGVSESGVFVKAANMTDWTTGDSGIPSGWTVQTV